MPINFYCTKCQESLPWCECPDLEERFEKGFWKSSLYRQAMAAVDKTLKRREKDHERERKAV